MRLLLTLGFLSLLSACSGDPRSYGITGPGTSAPPPPVAVGPEAEPSPTPGVSTGASYGPTSGPSSGASGFWGYN
jgi:hypothetical protein